jgi:RNA polymerase sigma-70 factor (ECF subfamily)
MSPANESQDFTSVAFVERLRAREPGAIQAVVHAYLPQIMRAALGAGLDRERAEDATQATFFTFISKVDSFEGRSHVRTWLFGILYNKIAETRRQVQRDEQMDDIDEVVERQFDGRGIWSREARAADADLQDAEIRKNLEYCLDTIPTQQRMAFVLREVEELTSEEICKALQVSRTNLGVLLFRARNRLRECLKQRQVG